MKQHPDVNAWGIVRDGYDRIAELYLKEREKFENCKELEDFCSKLPANAKVLDVGCGTGIPIARYLIDRGFKVVGIDLSKEMLSVARRNVPDATFRQMNMVAIDFPPGSFDGLISCYAIFHVPRDNHAAIFQSFHTILKPHGTMLVSVGSSEWEEVESYYGVKMFWSHFHPTTTESLITDSGFRIEFGRIVESGDETHYWILAHK